MFRGVLLLVGLGLAVFLDARQLYWFGLPWPAAVPIAAGLLACGLVVFRAPLGVWQVMAAGFTDTEQTLVATAIATARDAVARRNPNGVNTSRSTEEPGLRGGMLRFPDHSTITLVQVRLVSDVDVTGRVSVQGEDRRSP